MSKLRPCWGFHLWSKWIEPKKTNVYRDIRKVETELPLYMILEQHRECERCGLVQYHREKISYD